MEACLKGILSVSKLINSVGSGSPIGPKKATLGLLLKGMMICFLSSCRHIPDLNTGGGKIQESTRRKGERDLKIPQESSGELPREADSGLV